MEQLNAEFYALLDRAFELVEPVGTPIAVIAWLAVFAGSVGLGLALRGRGHGRVWLPAVVVGTASLAAHLLDYAITLRMSPDLAVEANPLWRIVVERWGLETAKLYGLSGKILLSILSFEFFALYLVHRDALYPERAAGFLDFWRNFGEPSGRRRRIQWKRLASFFSFSFALLGPFFFYVALLNSLAESPAYHRLPAMPIVLIGYLALTTSAYFALTYRAFRARAGATAP